MTVMTDLMKRAVVSIQGHLLLMMTWPWMTLTLCFPGRWLPTKPWVCCCLAPHDCPRFRIAHVLIPGLTVGCQLFTVDHSVSLLHWPSGSQVIGWCISCAFLPGFYSHCFSLDALSRTLIWRVVAVIYIPGPNNSVCISWLLPLLV